jgi:peptide/nickel transport system substrate-binding protein
MTSRTSLAGVLLAAILALCGGGLAQLDRVVIGSVADASGLDPRLVADTPSLQPIHAVMEPLVAYDRDLGLVPRLATGWEVSDEGVTIRFALRPGVTFHHGKAFTAEDVRFTFESLLDPELGSPLRSQFAMIERIETPDDHTVVFHLRSPNAFLVSRAARVPIVPADMAMVPAVFSLRPYGTGPYRFDSWVRGDRLVLTRFDDYWGGAGGPATLEFRVVPDVRARLEAFETGEVDIVQGQLPPAELERLAADPDVVLERTPGTGYTYLGFNTRSELLADVRVRQALSHLIPREAIVERVMAGNAVPGVSMLVPTMPWFPDDAERFEYDPARARELVDELELDQDAPLRLLTNDNAVRIAMAETLAEEFGRVGLAVDVVVEGFAEYLERLHQTADYDLFLLGWSDQVDPERATTRQFHSGPLGTANYGYYANPRVDELIELGLRTDPASDESVAIYREIATIVADDAPVAFVLYVEETALHRPGIEGWHVHPYAPAAYQDAHLIRAGASGETVDD